MEILYYLGSEMAAYWILLLILQYVCSAHMNLNRKNMILCSVLIFCGSMAVYLSNSASLRIGYMFVLLVVTVLIFSRRRLKDLVLFFPAFIIYLILSIVPEVLLIFLFPIFETQMDLAGEPRSFLSLFLDVFVLAILLLLRHVLLKYESTVHFSVKEVLGSLALFFFSMVDLAFLVTLRSNVTKTVSYYVWHVVFIGAFLFSVGYYLFTLIERRVRIYRQAVTRNEMEYLRLQLDALQEKQEDDEEAKRLRHDLKSHLTVLQTLCQEGNFEEVRRYTGQLSGEIISVAGSVITGNKVADLVIHSKMKTAKEHGIEFTFEGTLEKLEHMAAPDICGLLANAYDNAIEACMNQKEAWIHTTVNNTRNYTVIQISNSLNKKVIVRGNDVSTTKKDKSAHGYGIGIMKSIAHKYNGSCTLSGGQEKFCVKIVLLI